MESQRWFVLRRVKSQLALCLLWFPYAVDIFVVWLHGPERLQSFPSHLKSLRPSIHFTLEIALESAIAFLDVLIIRKGTTLVTEVYRKLTHIGR
jgi:hypothetical protein